MKIENKYEIVLTDEDLRTLVAKALLDKVAVSVSTEDIVFMQQPPVLRDGGPIRVNAIVRGTQKKEVP